MTDFHFAGVGTLINVAATLKVAEQFRDAALKPSDVVAAFMRDEKIFG